MQITGYGNIANTLSRDEVIKILDQHYLKTTDDLVYTVNGIAYSDPNTSFDATNKIRNRYSTKLVFTFLGY